MGFSNVRGTENRIVDIERPSHVENKYGAETESFVVVAANVMCRIDNKPGPLRRAEQGAQPMATHTMFVVGVDVRPGDKITNVRWKYNPTVPDTATLNSAVQVTRQNEYIATAVPNPGSEFSHLEVDLYEIVGQKLN